MNRNQKTELEYRQYKKENDEKLCIFCNPPKHQIVKESKNFWILKNDFAYAIWDYKRVTSHLMIIPKKHTNKIKDLSESNKKEYIDQLSNFENDGYNLYTRTHSNKSKSVGHFHTHLIKTIDPPFVSLTYQQEPYISNPEFK